MKNVVSQLITILVLDLNNLGASNGKFHLSLVSKS